MVNLFVFAKLLKGEYPNLEYFSKMSFLKLVTFQSYISTKKTHPPPTQGLLDEILDICKEPSIYGGLSFSQKEKAVREN